MTSNLRILLAEDNEVNQHLMVRILSRIGYEVTLAKNGIQVLNKMDKADFDLIFMDIMMPEMDGVTATKLIRHHYAPEKQPKIYALTAETSTEGHQKYLAAGMNGILNKPIKIEEITALLENLSNQVPSSPSDPQPSQNRASSLNEFPVLDTAVIGDFMELMGEEGVESAKHLVDLYKTGTPDLIKKIEIDYRVKDQVDLLKQIHTVKGSSSQVGARRLEQLCTRLEVLVKQSGIEPFGTFITAIHQEFDEVTAALDDFVSSLH